MVNLLLLLLYSLFLLFHFSSVPKPALLFPHLTSHSLLSTTLQLCNSEALSQPPSWLRIYLSIMWTMDSSDRSDLTVSDSFHGRKLRPLVPRLNPSVLPKMTVNSSMAVTPCFSHLHPGNDLFSLNHRLGGVSDHQSKNTDFANSTQPPFGSSRWNPTPEQLQALEELYRRGTRTPTAEQIQQIAAQLRMFGKIEGKNVFYWFQNHKARERQKRRRELESHPADHHQQQQQEGDDHNNNNNGKNLLERKESVMRRTSIEVEQTKNWVVPSSNCSTTLSEESVSIHRAGVAESGTDGWMQLEERELQQTRSTVERQAAAWHFMGLTSSPPYRLIDSITTAAAAAEALNTIYPKEKPLILRPPPSLEHETRDSQAQTLQLFPVQGDHISCSSASNRYDDNNNNNNEVVVHSAEGDNELAAVVAAAAAATDPADLFTPNQFFEFL